MRFVLVISFLLFASVSSAQTPKDKIIDNLEREFARMQTLSAKFRQVFHNADLGETEVSTGTVVIKKPLKMRWLYEEPYKQTIISDGKKLYLYLPAEKQVMVEPLINVFDARSPALFLSGNNRLSELFHIKLEHDEKKDNIEKEAVFFLKPKQNRLTIKHIVIRADTKTWLIRSFSLYDWMGNRTDIYFSSLKVNGKIDDREFIFKKPKGVEEVEMPRIDIGVE